MVIIHSLKIVPTTAATLCADLNIQGIDYKMYKINDKMVDSYGVKNKKYSVYYGSYYQKVRSEYSWDLKFGLVWISNGPDFEWDLKSGSPTI